MYYEKVIVSLFNEIRIYIFLTYIIFLTPIFEAIKPLLSGITQALEFQELAWYTYIGVFLADADHVS